MTIASRCAKYIIAQVTQLQAIERALRARVAELESKLAESEDWKNSLANDAIRTSHENMELQAKLAAATKRAGEEPKNG